MLVFKLRPIGKKHQKTFRIIVQEKREKLQGRFVEDIGWLNPFTDKRELNKEKVAYWLKNGVQPTDTVYNLFVSEKLLAGPKRPVHKKSKAKEGEEEKKEQVQPKSSEQVKTEEVKATAPSA